MSKLIITLYSFAILLLVICCTAALSNAEEKTLNSIINHRPQRTQTVPDSFDLADHGFNIPISNSQQCAGGNVANSIAETIAGVHMVKHGLRQAVALSAAQLVDCSYVEFQCDGGDPGPTVDSLVKNAGGLIATNASYPYSGSIIQGNPGPCRMPGSTDFQVGARVTGHVDLPNNEEALQEILVRTGPISIAVDDDAVQEYNGGILSDAVCKIFNFYQIALTLQGYKTTIINGTTVKYWIARSTFGSQYGEKGLMYLPFGKNCSGLAGMARSVTVA
jgi:hypothetical protein